MSRPRRIARENDNDLVAPIFVGIILIIFLTCGFCG
jgi:hypothetical protein